MPKPADPPADAGAVNREYYGTLSPGREDYWKRMAAPRFRMATLLGLLSREPADSLVDLGCGNGELLREIRESHPRMQLAGIDLSETQTEANRERLPGIDWHARDLEGPEPLPDTLRGRYDAVVASEIIEHLAEPRRFLATALSLAVPGKGRLLLSTQSGPVRATERRVGHLRHFAREEMESLLEGTGWQPERVWNAGYPFHDLSKWWANRDPEASLTRFADRPYGPAEKLLCLLLRGAFRLNSSRRGAQLFAVARRA